MATTAQTFYPTTGTIDQTLTGAATVRLLSDTNGALDTTTKNSYTASATQTVIPFTSSSAGGDTSNNNGWVFNNTTGTYALGSTSAAQRVLPAGTWTFSGSLTFVAPALLATGSATVTAKVYRVAAGGGVRSLLFSVNFAASTWTAAQTNNISITTSQPQYVLAAGEVLMVGYTIASADTKNVLNASTTSVITFNVGGANGAAVVVPTPGVRTLFTNPVTDAVTSTDTITQSSSHPRTTTESVPTSEGITRAGTYSRTITDSQPTSDSTNQNSSHPRTTTDTLTLSDTTTRVYVAVRATTDSALTSDVTSRSAITFRRLATDNFTTSDATQRALIYGRFTYEYPAGVTPDYTVQFPTRQIAGTVFDHETGNPVAGATVKLYRDSDDKLVQTATSDGSGAFAFPRDLYDPYTYHYTADYTVTGTQYHGISDRGLVPA